MFQNNDNSREPNGSLGLVKDVLRGIRRNFRSSMRNAMTREQMVSSAKSLAWIAPLTILIWVYAEREQIRPSELQAIRFTVRTNDPTMVVTVLNPTEPTITAQLRGPQQAIEQVIRELQPGGGSEGAVLIAPSVTGEQDIPTRTIRDAALFRDAGIEVYEESPPTLKIRVDKLVDVDVEVQPPQGMGENFTAPPQFEPRTVKINGPESVLKSLSENDALTVVAELQRFTSIRTPGRQVLQDVPLSLPEALRGQPNVKVLPNTVVATVDVKNAERETQIEAIPIWPLYPPEMPGKFEAKLDANFVYNVFVVGPADQIERIRNGTAEPSPKAILEIAPEDATKPNVPPKRVRIELPEGVRVGPQSQNVRVGYSVVPVGDNTEP